MSVIRWERLSMADAEQVVAQIWRVLEEHRVASPRMALAVQGSDRVDLSLTFGAASDAELVRRALAAPGLPPIAELETATREPAAGSARSGRGTAMIDYRCYLLGLSGSIRAAHDIVCEDDEVAVAKGRELFHPHAFEVWQRQRRVYPVVETSRGLHHAANLEQARRWRCLLSILLTGGEAHDCTVAERLIRRTKAAAELLGDKAQPHPRGGPFPPPQAQRKRGTSSSCFGATLALVGRRRRPAETPVIPVRIVAEAIDQEVDEHAHLR